MSSTSPSISGQLSQKGGICRLGTEIGADRPCFGGLWPWSRALHSSRFLTMKQYRGINKSQSFCLQISQKYLCMNVHMKWKYPKITSLLSLLSKTVCVNKGVSRCNWSGLTYPNACTDLPAGAVLACTSLSFCLYVHLTPPLSLVIPRQVHPNTCKWQEYPLCGHIENNIAVNPHFLVSWTGCFWTGASSKYRMPVSR